MGGQGEDSIDCCVHIGHRRDFCSDALATRPDLEVGEQTL
jgi:hypothetical protein